LAVAYTLLYPLLPPLAPLPQASPLHLHQVHKFLPLGNGPLPKRVPQGFDFLVEPEQGAVGLFVQVPVLAVPDASYTQKYILPVGRSSYPLAVWVGRIIR
jgi:hypothetical protein